MREDVYVEVKAFSLQIEWKSNGLMRVWVWCCLDHIQGVGEIRQTLIFQDVEQQWDTKQAEHVFWGDNDLDLSKTSIWGWIPDKNGCQVQSSILLAIIHDFQEFIKGCTRFYDLLTRIKPSLITLGTVFACLLQSWTHGRSL